LTGKKIGMEPTMELYFNRKEGAGKPPKYKQKAKDQRKGGKTQCSSGRQKEQATKAQRI